MIKSPKIPIQVQISLLDNCLDYKFHDYIRKYNNLTTEISNLENHEYIKPVCPCFHKSERQTDRKQTSVKATICCRFQDKYIPVEPRPCSRVGQLTHWGSHVDSHKDEHRQNYNPPTGDLRPGKRVWERWREKKKETKEVGAKTKIKQSDCKLRRRRKKKI